MIGDTDTLPEIPGIKCYYQKAIKKLLMKKLLYPYNVFLKMQVLAKGKYLLWLLNTNFRYRSHTHHYFTMWKWEESHVVENVGALIYSYINGRVVDQYTDEVAHASLCIY